MTTRARIAILLGLAAVAVAPAAHAGDGFGLGRRGHRGPPPIDRILERHADELQLDAATRESIRAIADRARAEEEPRAEELHDLRDSLRELLDAEAPKLEDVMALADRIGAAETELKKRRLRTLLEIRALLSPEQRRQLVQIFEERKARWRDRDREPPPPPDEE
jgi:Spy/CpxP family protein refolding chaperone